MFSTTSPAACFSLTIFPSEDAGHVTRSAARCETSSTGAMMHHYWSAGRMPRLIHSSVVIRASSDNYQVK
jgi:hypothetical protein